MLEPTGAGPAGRSVEGAMQGDLVLLRLTTAFVTVFDYYSDARVPDDAVALRIGDRQTGVLLVDEIDLVRRLIVDADWQLERLRVKRGRDL